MSEPVPAARGRTGIAMEVGTLYSRRLIPLLLSVALSVAACGGSAPTSKAPVSGPATGAPGGAPATAAPAKGTPAKGAKPVKIGWMGALTGFLADTSLDAKEGTQAAVAAINAHGGILGRPVQVVYEDTGTDPQKARQAAELLVLQDHVAGIVGDYFSPNTDAAAPIVQKYHVPMISYEAAAGAVGKFSYVFRSDPSTRASAGGIADYAIKTLHEHSFVMIGGTDSYSQNNMRRFQQAVAKDGGRILASESYNPSATKDFSPYLIRFRGQKVDAFYLAGSPAPNALIMKQARALGLKTAFIGPTGLNRHIIWTGAGQAAVGALMCVDVPAMAINGGKYLTPGARRFERQWLKAGHSRFTLFDATHSYDATALLLKAIAAAGTTAGPKVRAEIFKIGHNYPGTAGRLTIAPDGGAILPMFIMRWGSDGNLHIVEPVAS